MRSSTRVLCAACILGLALLRGIVATTRAASARVALGLLLVFGFVQTASAQNPLNFGNNFFVTGDYVVGGAYGLNVNDGNGYAIGRINIPDSNPGITGTKSVPQGAQMVAALVYWQTVEPAGVVPGQPGSGAKGFFRPVFPGGPPTGYPITGVNVASQNKSFGGCTGNSTRKVIRTYRADVRGFLPLDANGNVLANTDGTGFNGYYEVRLPSNDDDDNPPLTRGATLVFIYSVVSPNFPLNVITINDGAYAPGNASSTMTQTVQGFYDAAENPVSRLTQIVGNGKMHKFQTVSLNGTPLPSLYGSGQPAFPGFYGPHGDDERMGTWDNPTWTFPATPNPPSPGIIIPQNPVHDDEASATTQVVPSASNQGCVAWAAVIVSTTINDPDKDGIPPAWKNNKGYTDVATGQFVSLADPDPLNQPQVGHQDIFIQMDHVVDSKDFTPDPVAVSMVKTAFLNHNIHLHITDASQTTGFVPQPGQPAANVIQEPGCTDKPFNSPPFYCPYPNQPGITTWRYGFEFVKNQPLNDATEADCEANSPPLVPIGPLNCVRRFPIAQRNSHHYVVFGDTLGAANWTFLGGILTGHTGTGPGTVSQVNNTVTFYTSNGHGLTVDNMMHTLANGRVTVSNAITNPNLNGTFFVTGVSCPANPDPMGMPCDVTNKAVGLYSFTISIGGHSITTSYTLKTDPNLAVASGQAGSGSGLSDVGGNGTLVTLGKWGADATVSAKAGTLMHELGHTLGLAIHGGSYYDHLPVPPGQIPDYRPTIEANCKSNYQSVMNYMFQTRLLGTGVVDFSSQHLSTLDETKLLLGPITTTDPKIAFPTTDWYDTKQTFAFKAADHANPAPITGFAITSNVVTFAAANSFMAGTIVQITGLTSGTYLNRQVLTVTGASGLGFTANFTHADVPPTADSGTAVNGNLVGIGTAATHHCDDTPLKSTDSPTYFYQGGTAPSMILNEIDIPWSSSALDANFEGNTPGSEPPFRGYNDWANVDPRLVGATGSSLLGPGGLFSGPGGLFSGPGGLFSGPGGLFSGPGGLFSGPGGLFSGPGGLFSGPGGLFSGPGELDLRNALSATPALTDLSASEGVSPRTIKLTWTELNFPATVRNNIYRSSDGVNFAFLASVAGITPGAQANYTDNVTCNPNGYSYFVTTVVLNTTLTPPQEQESTQSNTVNTGSDGKLTGCYTLTGFSSPASGTQGSIVPITLTLKDDFNTMGAPVNRFAAITSLVAIGPNGSTTLVSNGLPTTQLPATFTVSGGVFTFMWDTDPYPAGSYFFKVVLDSTQSQTTTSALQLAIDVNDTDTTPRITTISLPDGFVGKAYTYTIAQHGGTAPFMWTVASGSLPPGTPGISLDPLLGTLSGTTCAASPAANPYSFVVKVTDSAPARNFGMQPLTLNIQNATTTTSVTSSPINPSTYGQAVTFTATVTSQYVGCPPTGSVQFSIDGTAFGSPVLVSGLGATATATSGAIATLTVSGSPHAIKAVYTNTDQNFQNSNGSLTGGQAVNPAPTSTMVTSSQNPSIYGQSVTFTATVSNTAGALISTATPTGSVQFSIDGTAFGSPVLVSGLGATATATSGAIATLTVSGSPHAIKAVYTNTDQNFQNSNGSMGQTVSQAGTTTSVTSSMGSSTYGQTVTLTATVSAVSPGAGTPTGTVQFSIDGSAYGSPVMVGPCAPPVPNAVCASFSTSATQLVAGMHSITAVYNGDPNFNASNSANFLQTVNMASTTTTINSVSPAPAFVGQPITVAYNLAVVPPGAGIPTGTITVAASDGSMCIPPAAPGVGACVLSPAPTTAGSRTFTITYSGDTNFVASGANGGNYTVYQLVFTAQPSNTGVGLTMTPAVQVAAQDGSNTTLLTFTGGITLVIGSGPGTLSGTTTQNAVSGVATFNDLSINTMANAYTLVASLTGSVAPATSTAFNIDTFYVDGLGNFGTLDLATGVVTQIGSGTVPGSTGLDLTPSLSVYEYNKSNQLMQITPSTGAPILVGTGTLPNPNNTTTGALTTGSYFAIDMVTGILYSIDLTTGATTQVGSSSTSTALVPAGCGFEASLTGSANMLYYTIGSNGVVTGCTAFNDTLYVIDPTSGATTNIGQVTINGSGVNAFVGSAFVGGALYGFTAGGQEYAINPATGVAKFLTNTTAVISSAGSAL